MAIKERYRDNVFFVYPPTKRALGGSVIEWGKQPFIIRGNYVKTNKNKFNPVGDVNMASLDTYIKTDTQKDIPQYSRITTKRNPQDNANDNDFMIVVEVELTPIKQKGNRYRAKEYYSRMMKVT